MIEFSFSRSASVRNALAAKAGRLRLPSSARMSAPNASTSRGEAGRARFHDLARDRVGVDDVSPQLGEPPRDRRFACSHAPGEADSQHRFSLASRHAGPDSGQIRQADDVVRYVRFGLVWARCRKRVSHGQQEKTRRSAPPRHARWGALHPHPGCGRGARDTPSQLVQRVAEPGAAQLRRDAPPHRRRYQDAVGAETGDNLRKRQKEWLGPLGPGHSSVLRSHHGYRFAAAAAGGVELSHVIRAGMTTYPGLPGPEIAPHLTPGGFPLALRAGHRVRRSAASRWSATPAPTSTAPSTATPTAPTSPASRCRRSPTCRSRWCTTRPTVTAASDRTRCVARRRRGPGGAAAHRLGPPLGHAHYGGPAPVPHRARPRIPRRRRGRARRHRLGEHRRHRRHRRASRAHHPARRGHPRVEHLTGLSQLPLHRGPLHAAAPLVAGFGTFPVRAYAVLDD